MPKWEHKLIIRMFDDIKAEAEEEFGSILAYFGKQGWEMVNVFQVDRYKLMMILKRPIAPQVKHALKPPIHVEIPDQEGTPVPVQEGQELQHSHNQ